MLPCVKCSLYIQNMSARRFYISIFNYLNPQVILVQVCWELLDEAQHWDSYPSTPLDELFFLMTLLLLELLLALARWKLWRICTLGQNLTWPVSHTILVPTCGLKWFSTASNLSCRVSTYLFYVLLLHENGSVYLGISFLNVASEFYSDVKTFHNV